MTFDAYDRSLDLARSCVPLLKRLATLDTDLAKQLRRALQGIALNISEGSRRAGKDRRHLFRCALGSADEVAACIDLARTFGYVADTEVAAACELVDRVRAMTFRLANR